MFACHVRDHMCACVHVHVYVCVNVYIFVCMCMYVYICVNERCICMYHLYIVSVWVIVFHLKS